MRQSWISIDQIIYTRNEFLDQKYHIKDKSQILSSNRPIIVSHKRRFLFIKKKQLHAIIDLSVKYWSNYLKNTLSDFLIPKSKSHKQHKVDISIGGKPRLFFMKKRGPSWICT